MFFKTIYNSLFNIESYIEFKNKTLFKAISYILALMVLLGGVFSFLSYNKIKSLIDTRVDKIYSLVPNFELSLNGLKFKEESKVYNFKFAGMNFSIDDSKTYLELLLEDKLNETQINKKTYIGKDGFGLVEGSKLKRAIYFKDMSFLKNQSLSKDDFKIIYETIKLFVNDMFIAVILIVYIVICIVIFIKSIVYAILLKCILYLKKEKLKFKDAYKLVLYSQTFRIIYSIIILFSKMNVIFPFKVMLIEIISIIYIFLIANTINKKERNK